MCHPEAISDLSFWGYLVSLSPGSCRVQVGIEMSKASLGKAAQVFAASGRPCRVCSALCWPKGPIAGHQASSGWTCSREGLEQKVGPHRWFSLALGVSRDCRARAVARFQTAQCQETHGLGSHKDSKAVVSPKENGHSE